MSLNFAVIGLGFGDEGKGVFVDYLANKYKEYNTFGVRHSGGHQCGHHVTIDDTRHSFSMYSSGSFRGVPTFYSKYCTVSLKHLINETIAIIEKGVKTPNIYIDYKCPITTEFEIQLNGTSDHGTVGVGFGKTLKREKEHYSLLFEDLLFGDEIFFTKLNIIKDYYKNIFKEDTDTLYDIICNRYYQIKEIIGLIVFPTNKDILSKNDINIFEGSQGLLLDQNNGFFPYATPSNTGIDNVYDMVNKVDGLYLLTRAYTTRHGNGPLPGDTVDFKIKDNPFENNRYNQYQGEFRKSILNIDLLRYAIIKNKNIEQHPHKILVISCIDSLEKLSFLKNNVIYTFDDKIDFIQNVYKEVTKDILGFSTEIFFNTSPTSETIGSINFYE